MLWALYNYYGATAASYIPTQTVDDRYNLYKWPFSWMCCLCCVYWLTKWRFLLQNFFDTRLKTDRIIPEWFMKCTRFGGYAIYLRIPRIVDLHRLPHHPMNLNLSWCTDVRQRNKLTWKDWPYKGQTIHSVILWNKGLIIYEKSYIIAALYVWLVFLF